MGKTIPKQSVEERRYLGPVVHGPYVPLRFESSESVTALNGLNRKCYIKKYISAVAYFYIQKDPDGFPPRSNDCLLTFRIS